MDWTLPPELDTAITGYYSSLKPSSTFASRLERELRQRRHELLQQKTTSRFRVSWNAWQEIMKILRAQPILTLLAVIIALLLLTGVAYAVGRLTGFIPGFGFTSESGSVYVLTSPVEVTAGNLRLRVDHAVNAGERFWVDLTVYGHTERDNFSRAYVLLPGGEKIQHQSSVSSGLAEDETKLSYIFPPLLG